MDTVRYGVIGVGWFGEKHVDVLSNLPNAGVLAVSRRSAGPLRDIAEKYRIPHQYTDYRDLLANPDIDAVSITTHVADHVAPAVDALRAGKHVFLEKPMAATGEECDVIIRAALAAGTCFMVGHICRFDPSYALAKRYIDEGRIGRIVSIYARRNIPKAVSESVLTKISPILGDGVHDTDLMLWYTGSRVERVYAAAVNVRNLPNPDIGWAMYTFEGGAVGTVESCWYLPETTPYELDARMEIIGETGALYLQSPGQAVALHAETSWKIPETVYWPRTHMGTTGALKEELGYFTQCVLSGRLPAVITPEESKAAVVVVDAAERSARTGDIVVL